MLVLSIHILKPGLFTTIQDTGRYGFQKYGVITSGAMDRIALRIANLLVGNDENEASFEITLTGPALQFSDDSIISICGADFLPKMNGERLPMWRPIFIRAGSIVEFSNVREGCRAYIAVAGGIDVPIVMGSKSTYIRAGIGGFDGRSLKRGDVIDVGALSNDSIKLMEGLRKASINAFSTVNWTIHHTLRKSFERKPLIRFIKGPQFDLFLGVCEKLEHHYFKVSPQSDRMGYRLLENKLELTERVELYSEAVPFGTIQVPPDGNPIILMADKQTTGGYPVLGVVASVDLSLLAQVKPGDEIKLQEITLEDAENEFIELECTLQTLKQTVKLAIGGL